MSNSISILYADIQEGEGNEKVALEIVDDAARKKNDTLEEKLNTLSSNALLKTEKAKANGLATLDSKALIPTTQIPNLSAIKITQDTTHRFVTDTEKSGWNAKADKAVATSSKDGLMSSEDKTKLDGVATGANKYVHPTTAGNKHIPTGGSSGQVLKWKASGEAQWASDNNTTYAPFKGATSSAAGRSGLVPAPAAGKQAQFLRGDGTWAAPTDTKYSNMTGASASAAGKAGLVPAPAAGNNDDFLKGDGKWGKPTKADVGLSNVPNVTTDNQTPTFSQASTRSNIVSKEKLSVIMGKIMKWFSDLKPHAFANPVTNTASTSTTTALAASVGKELSAKDAELQNQINSLNSNLQNSYLKIQYFKLDAPNRALNVSYNIGNLGYCPFFVFLNDAFYFLDVDGTNVSTNVIGKAGIKLTKISDISGVLSNIEAFKGENNDKTKVRIKFSLTSQSNFIGIVPLRLDVVEFLGHYQAQT